MIVWLKFRKICGFLFQLAVFRTYFDEICLEFNETILLDSAAGGLPSGGSHPAVLTSWGKITEVRVI